MAIEIANIRARIDVGGVIVKTPYVQNFSVNKTRNSKSTFKAGLKIHADELGKFVTNKVTIEAGELGDLQLIFTGFILSVNPTPCWDDPNYVMVNISGADVLYKLEDERYTRRQVDSKSKWAVIQSVQRQTTKNPKFKLVKSGVLLPTDGTFNNPTEGTDIGSVDLSKYGQAPPKGKGHPIEFNITTQSTIPET